MIRRILQESGWAMFAFIILMPVLLPMQMR